MNNEISKFKKSLFELFPDLITDETGKNFLYSHNVNGIFGNNIKDFLNINKLLSNKNFLPYFKKNNFYIYCTDDSSEQYINKVKSWGFINIVNVQKGEEIFFEKTKKKQKTKKLVKLIQKNGKIYNVYDTVKQEEIKYTIKPQYKDFFMLKFDRATINPPYDGNLHLKILEAMPTIANSINNISPIEWLMNCYGSKDSSTFKELKLTDVKYAGLLKDIFENCDRSTLHMGLYKIDENAKYTPKDFITKFVTVDNKNFINQRFISDFINKIKNHKVFLEDKIKTGEINENTKWTIVVPKLVGNPGQKCYKLYTENSRWDKIFYKGVCNGITPSGNKKKLKNVKNYTIFDYIEFETENEAKNWCLSWNSNFLRFAQIIQSIDGNRRCKYTPYMEDYTKPWTDERYCEYFFGEKDEKGNYLPNPGGFISDTQAIPGSDWEIIINTMKGFK